MLSNTRLLLHRRQPQSTVPIGTAGPFGLFSTSFSINEFHSHIYITGTIGTGKSKLLQHFLFELATAGAGCGVIDPHSDLATDLIAQLASYPKNRPWLSEAHNRQRILYIDPFHSSYVIPANILKSSWAEPQGHRVKLREGQGP